MRFWYGTKATSTMHCYFIINILYCVRTVPRRNDRENVLISLRTWGDNVTFHPTELSLLSTLLCVAKQAILATRKINRHSHIMCVIDIFFLGLSKSIIIIKWNKHCTLEHSYFTSKLLNCVLFFINYLHKFKIWFIILLHF